MFEYKAITESLKTETGLEHAIRQSLFNFAKAHANDELEPDQSKRGWWAEEFLSGVGCRDWTLQRSKQTGDTLKRAIHYTKIALDWLTPANAKSFDVEAWYEHDRLVRRITVTFHDGKYWETQL